ncbi:hypothetical protein Taro_042204 [Colocasia esculenta]|uniref:Uncharacterized protein n=1 Tax=Colocasia esculenta TaxID=4460 RepID=A0A843WXY7_COLES|nr:hypothetical protein [Colocasia esculenta]
MLRFCFCNFEDEIVLSGVRCEDQDGRGRWSPLSPCTFCAGGSEKGCLANFWSGKPPFFFPLPQATSSPELSLVFSLSRVHSLCVSLPPTRCIVIAGSLGGASRRGRTVEEEASISLYAAWRGLRRHFAPAAAVVPSPHHAVAFLPPALGLRSQGGAAAAFRHCGRHRRVLPPLVKAMDIDPVCCSEINTNLSTTCKARIS